MTRTSPVPPTFVAVAMKSMISQLEELLSNAGAVQESERAGLSGEYVTENLEDVIQNDCDGDTHPEPRRGEITGRYVDSAYR